jgi:putative spermidine/putrescine transport system permease protein
MQASSAIAQPVDRSSGRSFLQTSRWSWGLLPAGIVLLVAFLLPLANLALRSLHLSAGPGEEAPGLTLANYQDFVSDPFYWQLLLWTSALGALVVGVSLILAVPTAYFLARSHSRARHLLFFAVVAPLLISVVIRNLGWIPVLGENGLVNWLLMRCGLIASPLHLVNNLFGVTVGLVHALVPFLIMTLTTVIQRIGPELEEASLSLGAGPVRTFLRVLFPLMRPGLIGGSLVIFTLAISAYTTPALMGGGRVLVLATYIQQEIATLLDYAKGAAVAIILMAWSFALSVGAMKLGRMEAE